MVSDFVLKKVMCEKTTNELMKQLRCTELINQQMIFIFIFSYKVCHSLSQGTCDYPIY